MSLFWGGRGVSKRPILSLNFSAIKLLDHVECEVRALVGAQQTAEHAAVYTLPPRQPSALVCAHASHLIATGVAARHIIQADNTTQSVVTAQNA
jgi:hypothetical protein